MISVERIEDFRDLPSEAAFTNDYDQEVSLDWPQNGSIDVQNLSVRYRDGLPLSLRNLSFKIDGGSRVGKSIATSSIVGIAIVWMQHSLFIPQLICSSQYQGIVGRTGCGKSTLLQSLLRLLEADSGQIVMDDIVSS